MYKYMICMDLIKDSRKKLPFLQEAFYEAKLYLQVLEVLFRYDFLNGSTV